MTGQILGDEDLSVEGNVVGPISLGTHRLTVGSRGRVAGEVVASEVIVHGAIEGNVRASRIEIKRAGSLIGDLTTARIAIEDGAYFKGHIEIGTAPQMSKPANKESWWCANCASLTELDAHGRCAICGSDAVNRRGADLPQTR